MKKALVLLSGGQDSTTCLAMAAKIHEEVNALSVFYGQQHSKELVCASYQAKKYAKRHHLYNFPGVFTESPLITGRGIPEEWSDEQGPAPTIVPGRNLVLLGIAASLAEQHNYQEVWIGVSQVDSSGYPDCTKNFVDAARQAIHYSTQGKVTVVAPLVNYPKAYMIEQGTSLGVEWEKTWTCYRGDRKACGRCPACKLRLEAFKECGMVDPLEYEEAINADISGN